VSDHPSRAGALAYVRSLAHYPNFRSPRAQGARRSQFVSAHTGIKGHTDVPDQTTCRQDRTVDETSLQGLVVVVVVEMADPLSTAPVIKIMGRL
jgi:hypothetical protein